MDVSVSEGDCLDGLLAAILFNAADDIFVMCERRCGVERKKFDIEFKGRLWAGSVHVDHVTHFRLLQPLHPSGILARSNTI
jgi:uncharacterized Fe-S radical SAM superfamily protein PflX